MIVSVCLSLTQNSRADRHEMNEQQQTHEQQ